jgi:ATP/maltotriose-dependent transcriptional regulator MalT
LLTPEYLQGLSTFTLRYFENLYQRLRRPSILVFDNYQEVPPEASFHEIILQGLSNTPEGINTFLISRQDPPAGLVRLEANHQMGFLPWNELRLTLEESTGIAAVRFPEKLTPKSLHQLHRTADGWAAGLILLLERLKREKIDFKQLGKLAREEIFDYFANEILNPLDSETRDFLLKTALLPQMTESMAEKLTGQPQAGRTLARLNRGNYFIEKRVLEEPIYGYHPLFREFLLSRAEEASAGQNFAFFKRQAAEILEDHGQVESAVLLLQEIRDWETLIQLILKHAPVIHAQGRYSVLEGWLRSLPPGMVETRPWLAYWMGSSRMFADPAQSRPYFEQAYLQMRKEKDAAGLFMAWSGMMDDINLGYGFEPYSVLDRHLQELEEIRRDYPGFPSAEIEARVASAVVAALALRQPNHPEFEAWAERALRLAQDQRVVNMRIQSLFFLAYYHLYGGNREKALFAINQLRQMSQSRQASAYTKIMKNMAEAMHYCIVGLSRESMKAAQTGLELSQRSGVLFAYHGFLAFAGFAAFQMNDLQAGRSYLRHMTSFEGNLKPLDTTYYYLLKANEALVSGKVRQASLHADLAMKMALDVGSPPLTIRCQLVKARALAEAGRRAEATNQLKQAADLSRQMKIGFGEFCCLFTQAQFDFDWREEKNAWMTLRKALSLGKERGLMGIYIDRPATTARVCMKALEAGIEVDYIQEMIRERNLMPERPPWHLENWPWPLKIFTLGRFAILKDGKLIRFTRKV